MPEHPFHLAFPVDDLEETRVFYTETLGCRVGRQAPTWIDFDFYGHQISAHLSSGTDSTPDTNPVTNLVDGDAVPVRHFGVVLNWEEWKDTAESLRDKGVRFIIEPHIRFEGQVGEQATLFFTDPSGNTLELKSFRNIDRLFASFESAPTD
jgi:extradiol dioxygenase family protein